jgi:ParB-like nuclease domain
VDHTESASGSQPALARRNDPDTPPGPHNRITITNPKNPPPRFDNAPPVIHNLNKRSFLVRCFVMNALEIRTLPVAELKPAPYNPRRVLAPKSAAYRKLKASLAEFGLVEPLVWNELTGHVVGGHARLRVLKELGVTKVPVSVVRLTEAREKALNIVTFGIL